ncbi:MAG: hypothetical protein A2176_01000 [Spirochaetes bacterium RBG_13_51_14]|nr:MAG: hypothetical protein A2176_01000 [Spirochaetes bacterium RBG_13_51_14]
MSSSISFIAGSSALQIIRDEGLKPDRISVVAGAAGGPKWLVLGGIDRALFPGSFRNRKKPLFMIGSSIGSWRFAALAQNNQKEALDVFESAYLDQSYSRMPTAAEVTDVSQRILDSYVDDAKTDEILGHPYLRLSMLSVRSKGIFTAESRSALAAGMALASLCNIFSRGLMRLFFNRTIFYDPRDIPPFINLTGFPIHRIPLTSDNFRQAVIASGSIPLVMSGVRDIPGAPGGVYRDGGMLDYHLDIPFDPDHEHLVLYPHYTDRIIPGWLDKHLPWRKAHDRNMSNVLIVCPSKSFVSNLPFGKIPDRNDFMRFRGRDKERLAYWNAAVAEGRKLGDAFSDAVESGSIRRLVRPY